jgi:hypothetical protein
LTIELAGPVADEAVTRLGDLLSGMSVRFETPRRGYFDVNVEPERLGIVDADRGGARPLLVIISGPGFGDEDTFEAEHAEDPDPLALIGFRPTHDVGVLAGCNGDVDHLAAAVLTAAVMEIVGGIASVELRAEHVEIARGLPGLVGLATERWTVAYGTAQFVRAWAAHPRFRLVK